MRELQYAERSCLAEMTSAEPEQEFGEAVCDVSVCIVNWNCRDMLRACLRSLITSQGLPLEIIVVDNASSDGAADMVASEFPSVRLIRNSTNAGFSRAN